MTELQIKKLDMDYLTPEEKAEIESRMEMSKRCRAFVDGLEKEDHVKYSIDICQTYYNVIKKLDAAEVKDEENARKLARAMMILDYFDFALGAMMAQDLNQNKPEKKDLN